jgi:transposase-like protein
MARVRRTCTREFKVEAVELVTAQGYSVAEAARSLGVHQALLRSWKQTLQAQGDPRPSRRSCAASAPRTSASRPSATS